MSNITTRNGEILGSWDGEHVAVLLGTLEDLYDAGHGDVIDMSALPWECQIPDVLKPYTHYPIWACDRHGKCLVGDGADTIEDVEEILDILNLTAD